MPLIAAAVLSYAAGLLAGFADASGWRVVPIVAAVWWGGRSRRDRLALSALAVAGLAVASAATRATSQCVEKLMQPVAFNAVIASDANPGAFVRGRAVCGARVWISVASGSAAGGSTVVVLGAPVKSRAGVMLSDATVRLVTRPGVLRRWRDAIGRGIDRHFAANSPLVRALLIADMDELSPTVRDRYSAAGLSHMLSVSGLHVGLIATAVLLLAQIAGVNRGRADVLVVSITVAYVAVIGAPLPAVRSAAMLAAASLSVATQRPTSPWAVLAIGAGLPLVDGGAMLDLGYQLSVVGMVALIAAAALNRRWEWLALAGWRGTLYRSLVTSMAATLLTAPLVAGTFGRVSLAAPLTNLVAVPIAAILQPMLFLAALLMPIPAAAQFVADACHPLLAGLDAIAAFAAAFPGASIAVTPAPATTALAVTASTCLVVACVSRFPARAMIGAAACVVVLVWRPIVPARSDWTELHMIDVGQGDAIGIRSTRGRWVLFDAGRAWSGGDAGARDVVPYLRERGGTLEAFVLSHPHADHVGGAASTLSALEPRWYFDPAYAGGSAPYRSSLFAAQREHIAWRRVHPGDSLVVDEITVTFLAPDSAWASTLNDPNEASAIARVRVGRVTMLFTGDAEAREEEWLVANYGEALRSDILKVAHHGSRTSSSASFLDAVRPRLALVSVGAGNVYRHPSAEVLRTIAAQGAIAVRTDRNGTVIVRTDGARIEVEAQGERWPLRPRCNRASARDIC